MLNKADTLEQLRNAKKAHVKWVQRAKALIEGLPVEKEQIPVDCTACAFGEWFYSDAQKLNAIPNMTCLKEIETQHFELHDIYMKIFKIYFSDTGRSLFSKLLGTQKKITESEKEMAQEYFRQLKETSERLLEQIEKLERRLMALQSGLFAEV